MRAVRWMIVAFGVLGGTMGLGAASHAAPLPVAGLELTGGAPLAEPARWYRHRRHWHRRHHGQSHHGWHRPHRARLFY